jgi:hypothetical protein
MKQVSSGGYSRQFFLEKGSKLFYKLLTVATSFQDELYGKQLWKNIHGMSILACSLSQPHGLLNRIYAII